MTFLRLCLLAICSLLPLAAADQAPAAATPTPVPVTASSPAETPRSADAAPVSGTAPVRAPAHDKSHWVISKYKEGGLVMHVFLIVSIWMMAVLIERLVRLRRSAIVPEGLAAEAEAAWQRGDGAGVKAACAAKPSILAEMIIYAHESPGASGADILAGASEIASRGIRRHLQKLTPLAIITTLGPILGLFGAVLGLIECFEAMGSAGSMGDVKQIAGGIAIAFIATATGMAVAMPSLVGYHLLKMRTNQFLLILEQDFSGLITRQVIRAAAAKPIEPLPAAPAAAI